jgi:hypothetical protein
VTADSATAPFYVIRNLPAADVNETDESGQGGLINLPAGTVTISGTLSDSRMMGTVSVLVRAGGVTLTSLVPSP